MRPQPLPLPENQILVNSALLAERWNVHARTAVRVCRFHHVPEIRLRPDGRILFARSDIEKLERGLFNWS